MYFVFQPWWRLSEIQREQERERGREGGGIIYTIIHAKRTLQLAPPSPPSPSLSHRSRCQTFYVLFSHAWLYRIWNTCQSRRPPRPPRPLPLHIPPPLPSLLTASSSSPPLLPSVETLPSIYDPKTLNNSLQRHFTSKWSFISRLFPQNLLTPTNPPPQGEEWREHVSN